MYDKSDKDSILEYAKKLIGKNFTQIHQESLLDNPLLVQESGQDGYSTSLKGSYGHIIEKDYFGLTINSESRPDFEEAGVELKVSPIVSLKDNQVRAGERLVISMIPFNEDIESEFEQSSVFSKINYILFILYLRDKVKFQDRFDYPIKYVDLFSFYKTLSLEDQEIIKQDYKKIQSKIKAGLAHELSEGDTLYLGACTKGATAQSSYRVQYNNEEVLAKGRAFSFKQSFFSRLINEYIISKPITENITTNEKDEKIILDVKKEKKSHEVKEDKIITDVKELSSKSFEDIVLDRIQRFKNMSETDLFRKFNLNTKAKNKYSLLAFRMLDITSNSAEEFSKAGIVVKTIRLEHNNSIREHMSFTNVDLIEFSKEEWESSYVYNFFRETKFLFMIFEQNKNERYFAGAQFWNMPISDIDYYVKEDWLKTQNVLKDGVKFKKSGNVIKYNIPTPSQTKIFHLRPKAKKSAYSVFINNELYERGDLVHDSVELPDGQRMTKQCFWINKEYIIDQLEDRFKK